LLLVAATTAGAQTAPDVLVKATVNSVVEVIKPACRFGHTTAGAGECFSRFAGDNLYTGADAVRCDRQAD
jgi:hypothetical protein